MIHKNNPSVDYNYWLKSLDTELNELTKQNSIKVPQVDKPTNKKTWYYPVTIFFLIFKILIKFFK